MRRRDAREAAPRRSSHNAGESTAHDRRGAIQSEPDSRDQVRRVADEPGIRIVIGGAGLAGGRQLESRGARGVTGSRRNHIRQHARHQIRRRRADGLCMALCRTVDGCASGIIDAGNEARRCHASSIGERGVRRSQLQQRDLSGAERKRWNHRQLRLYPEPLRIIDGDADADLLKQLCGGAVARHFERTAKCVLGLLVPA